MTIVDRHPAASANEPQVDEVSTYRQAPNDGLSINATCDDYQRGATLTPPEAAREAADQSKDSDRPGWTLADLTGIEELAAEILAGVDQADEFAKDCTGLMLLALCGLKLTACPLVCRSAACRCSHANWLDRIALDLAAVTAPATDGIWIADAPKLGHGYGRIGVDGYGLPTADPARQTLVSTVDPSTRRALANQDWRHVAASEAPAALASILTDLSTVAAGGRLAVTATKNRNGERHCTGRRTAAVGEASRARVGQLRAITKRRTEAKAEQRPAQIWLKSEDGKPANVFTVAGACASVRTMGGRATSSPDPLGRPGRDRWTIEAPPERLTIMLDSMGIDVPPELADLIKARTKAQTDREAEAAATASIDEARIVGAWTAEPVTAETYNPYYDDPDYRPPD